MPPFHMNFVAPGDKGHDECAPKTDERKVKKKLIGRRGANLVGLSLTLHAYARTRQPTYNSLLEGSIGADLQRNRMD